MLQALRLSHKHLGDSAALVGEFLRSQLTPEGGFRDRSGRADLYYTVFGLESSLALHLPLPPHTKQYLLTFGLGDQLDLVHLCCLIRARATAGISTSSTDAATLKARLETWRTADGGYSAGPSDAAGSAYGCFLVAMAYHDLDSQVPSTAAVIQSLHRLRSADGGYANQPHQPVGLTPSTAAVATLLHTLGDAPHPAIASWLLSRRHPDSGFYAVPAAPIPDLLSTATALQALSRLGVPLDSLREPCLDFIYSLWTGGAFAGSWADSTADCEYTYYGLLALGLLAS